MKAVVINKFGNPDVFEMAELPVPSLKDDEILIEVAGGSVNPIDWKQRRGKHRFIFGAPFPIVLGYDVSGKVLKTGLEVAQIKVGDRVCGVLNNKYGGGLGQYAKGSDKCFAVVPESVDLIASAVLPLTGLTALQALRDKGRILPGSKVLIIGAAGGVGHFAQQIASLLGADVYSVSGKSHAAFLTTLSPHTFIDYTTTEVLSLNNRFDIIFDCTGKLSFLKCRHLLNRKGIYINTLPRPKILFHKLLAVFTRGKKARTLLMKHDSNDLKQLMQWVVEGKIKLCIDKEFPIDSMRKAHEYSEAGHTEGKILIRYNW